MSCVNYKGWGKSIKIQMADPLYRRRYSTDPPQCRMLTDQGWRDAIRHLHPKERIYTFWDYFYNSFERDAGLRLDHFLLSKHFDKRLKRSGVDRHVRGWEKTSDHAPAWIELSGY